MKKSASEWKGEDEDLKLQIHEIHRIWKNDDKSRYRSDAVRVVVCERVHAPPFRYLNIKCAVERQTARYKAYLNLLSIVYKIFELCDNRFIFIEHFDGQIIRRWATTSTTITEHFGSHICGWRRLTREEHLIRSSRIKFRLFVKRQK